MAPARAMLDVKDCPAQLGQTRTRPTFKQALCKDATHQGATDGVIVSYRRKSGLKFSRSLSPFLSELQKFRLPVPTALTICVDTHFITFVKPNPVLLAERTNIGLARSGSRTFTPSKVGSILCASVIDALSNRISTFFTPPVCLKSVQLGLISRLQAPQAHPRLLPRLTLHLLLPPARHNQSTCPRHLFRSPPLPSRRPPFLSTASSRRSPCPTSRANGEYIPKTVCSLLLATACLCALVTVPTLDHKAGYLCYALSTCQPVSSPHMDARSPHS